jgi:MYXO-CTERM domain-containing protein
MNESLQVGERFLIALPELEVLAVAAIAALAVLRRRRPA